MNQPPSSMGPSGPGMTGGSRGPGPHPSGAVAAHSPAQPGRSEQVDYGMPRLYETSVRPAGGFTRQRYAPTSVAQPQQAQPQSAWATQTRRVQEVSQQGSRIPTGTIVAWVTAGVLAVVTLFALTILMLLVFAQGGSELSVVSLPVFSVFALFSLVLIIGVIALADRWDPQPFPLLAVAVLWGVGVTLVAYIVNSLITVLLYAGTGSEFVTLFGGAAIGAPIVEETSKGAGLVLLLLLGRKYFNGPLDGLIYGALIGGGFAFTENIIYYIRQFADAGTEEAVKLVFQRGVLGIFGHPIYTSLTGVVMGLVVRKWGLFLGVLSFFVATWPGMLLHGVWNGGGMLVGGVLGEVLYYVVMYGMQAVLYVLWFGLIVALVFDESRLTRIRLGDYANQGWLTHQEVDMLATWKGRREGRAWARSIGAAREMKVFIKESAELASNRQRLLADGANPRALREEQRLLQRLTSNRQNLLAHTRR